MDKKCSKVGPGMGFATGPNARGVHWQQSMHKNNTLGLKKTPQPKQPMNMREYGVSYSSSSLPRDGASEEEVPTKKLVASAFAIGGGYEERRSFRALPPPLLTSREPLLGSEQVPTSHRSALAFNTGGGDSK